MSVQTCKASNGDFVCTRLKEHERGHSQLFYDDDGAMHFVFWYADGVPQISVISPPFRDKATKK